MDVLIYRIEHLQPVVFMQYSPLDLMPIRYRLLRYYSTDAILLF